MSKQAAEKWIHENLTEDESGTPNDYFTGEIIPARSNEEMEAWLYLEYSDYYDHRKHRTDEDVPAGVAGKRDWAAGILDSG